MGYVFVRVCLYLSTNFTASLFRRNFCHKRIYNRIVMNSILLAATADSPGVVTLDLSWASDVLALIGILGALTTVAAFWIRHEVKKNLTEIKAEFKPNGGGSLKDQVNRLEKRHNEMDEKVDRLDSKVDTIVNFILKNKDSE